MEEESARRFALEGIQTDSSWGGEGRLGFYQDRAKKK